MVHSHSKKGKRGGQQTQQAQQTKQATRVTTMGGYKFRWYTLFRPCMPVDDMRSKSRPLTLGPSHHRTKPAKKVLVTGTFDNWAGSQALDKVGDVFEKTVRIENTGDKVHYKVSGSFFLSFWGYMVCVSHMRV